MTTTAEQSELLDPAGLAAFLSVSKCHIWRLHSAGKIPAPVRISPKVLRWRRAELSAWLAAGCPSRQDWAKMSEKTRRNAGA